MNIIFDLDDTLYEIKDIFKKSVKTVTPDIPYDLDNFYEIFREEGHKLYLDSQTGVISMETMHYLRAKNAYKRIGIDLNDDIINTFNVEYYKNKDQIQLKNNVINTINTLIEKGHNVGIITNGESKKQRHTMACLDIKNYFPEESILISGDIGLEKPNTEIFNYYRKRCNNHEPFIYVGDSFENDVLGSYSAGWIPIWYNPDNKSNPTSFKDYKSIQSIDELLTLISDFS